MRTFSVKEIAEMLNTNPETVRRWIRDEKLVADMKSKKGGKIIYETALREFLKAYPKYANVAKAYSWKSAALGATVLPTVMLGSLLVQKMIDIDQLKTASISHNDIIEFLRGEIKRCTESINANEKAISRLQKQIEEDKSHVLDYQSIIDTLSTREDTE